MLGYSALVRDCFDFPGFAGGCQQPSHSGEAGARLAGGWVVLRLRLEQKAVQDIGYAVYGNPALIAAAEWVCRQLAEQPVERALALQAVEVVQALELDPSRRHAVNLVLGALHQALHI